MAIIFCTECNHQVSDKAQFCPNCGYSIENILADIQDKLFCSINGKTVDITEIKEHLANLTHEELELYRYIYSVHGMSDTIIGWMKKNKEKELKAFNDSCVLQRKYYPIFDLTPQAMDEFLCMFIDNNLEPFEFDGSSFKACQDKQRAIQASKPKCPTCGSPNIQKISATKKAMGAFGFGLLSKTARSQFECKNCGYKW